MRRLHPRSAMLRVAQAAVQGGFLGFFVGTAGAGMLGLPSAAIPLFVPLAAILAGAYGFARYLRFQYEIAGDTLRVESGVLARQSREIPLGRIQNVDVKQGIINRLLGLSVVEFETAGGSATEASLNAVDADEADRLRRLVQDYDRRGRSRGDQPVSGTPSDQQPGPSTPTSESAEAETSSGLAREILFAFTWQDLVTYAVVSVRPAAPVLTLVGLPLGSDLVFAVLRFNLRLLAANGRLGMPLIQDMETLRLAALAVLTVVQFVVLALLVSVVLTVVEYYQFTLKREDDDLRYERGLLRRYSGTIPLEKVQTVSIRENVLMRQFGYATLIVETAGYGPQSQQSSQGVAVPMAPREDVYDLARDIEPFGDLTFERPPTRARRRYAVRFAIVAALVTAIGYAVDTLVVGADLWWVLLSMFVVVVPAAHYRWANRGYALDEDALATRSGFWRRTTRIVPYYRVQTVFVKRTPFQRRRRLATVTADTASTASLVGGDASVYDVDADVAGTLRDDLRERLRTGLLALTVERQQRYRADRRSDHERPSHDADEEQQVATEDRDSADE